MQNKTAAHSGCLSVFGVGPALLCAPKQIVGADAIVVRQFYEGPDGNVIDAFFIAPINIAVAVQNSGNFCLCFICINPQVFNSLIFHSSIPLIWNMLLFSCFYK